MTDTLANQVFELLRDIKDPEFPNTLEQLGVVQEQLISVNQTNSFLTVNVEWVPTVPTCSLALTIALCIRLKLTREFSRPDAKIRITVAEGKHNLKRESKAGFMIVDKQVNDKERVLAALENPSVLQVVEGLIEGNVNMH